MNDFLSLGKLEEGKVEIIKAPIIVADFLEEVREDLIETLKPGQQIDVAYEAETDVLQSDVRILRNIFFNLISNASKYSDPDKTLRYIGMLLNHQKKIMSRNQN